MPLVNSSSGVEIPITAVDNASATIEKVDASLNNLSSAQTKSQGANNATASSVFNLNQALELSTRVIGMATDAYKEVVGAAVDYGSKVQQISLISGQSAENSSRLLDVFEKFGLTIGDVEMATRKMTANGLVPNLETIQKLSDQYNALQSPLEKNEFLMKNLGRSGLEAALLLSQGGEKIHQLSTETEKNLVLTQQQIDAVQRYKIAQSEFNDAIESTKVAIGNDLIPVATEAMNAFSGWSSAMDQAETMTGRTDQRSKIFAATIIAQNKAVQESADVGRMYSETMRDGVVPSTEIATQTMADLSLEIKGDLGKAYDDYYAKLDKINTEFNNHKLVTKMAGEAVAELKGEYQNGFITLQEYSTQVVALKKSIEDGTWAQQEKAKQLNAETDAYEKQTKQIIYNTTAQEINASTVLTSSQKLDALTQLGTQLGLVDQKTVDLIAREQELQKQLENGNITTSQFSATMATQQDTVGRAADSMRYAGQAALEMASGTQKMTQMNYMSIDGVAQNTYYIAEQRKTAASDTEQLYNIYHQLYMLNGMYSVATFELVTIGSMPNVSMVAGGGSMSSAASRTKAVPRASGGPLMAGQLAQVVESGEPEAFVSGGKTYLISGNSGTVVPVGNASGAARQSSAPLTLSSSSVRELARALGTEITKRWS